MAQQLPVIYEFGPFTLDPTEKVLRRSGEVILLSPKVVETLILLVEGEGKVQSKEALMDTLWPDSFVEEGSLTQNVSILRKNLGTDENGKQYIETLPKRGYRFATEIRKISGIPRKTEAVETTQEKFVDESPVEIPTAEPTPSYVRPEALVATPQARKSFVHPVMLVLLVVALSVAAAITVSMWERKAMTVAELKSIAILPFKDIRGERDEAYLGIGLTDSLITKLGNLKSLSVRPTSAIRKYSGTELDSVAIGKELGVEAVMEGTVRQDHNKLRITVQMVRVSDGLSLWSEQFDAEFTDLLKVEDSISSQVVMRLNKDLSADARSQLAKQYTANPEAHRLFLQGRHFWLQRTSKSMNTAIDLFQQAIKLDPNYALAYTGLADTYNLMGDLAYSYMPPTEAFPKARVAAQKALEIDETLAEAHTGMANLQMSYEWDLPGAEKSYKRALELNPNYFPALQGYTWLLIGKRQFREAEEMILRAKAQNPVSPVVAVEAGYPAFFAGEYDRAFEKFNAALEIDPNHIAIHFSLWRVYQQKGDYEKALARIDFVESVAGKQVFYTASRLATYAAMGRTADAEKLFQEMLADRAQNKFMPPVILALACADLGKKDEAIKYMEQAINERNDMVFIRIAPEYKNLQTDPRFIEQVRRVGLEP